MAQNTLKNNNNNNKSPSNPRPAILSHSRSISTVQSHKNNNISFMPKFLIKTLQRKKKQSHSHQSSGGSNDEKRGNASRIDKNALMQRVSFVMSIILRNNKTSDKEQSSNKDHRPSLVVKQGSELEGRQSSENSKGKSRSEVPCRVKSVRKKGVLTEAKGGTRIKGIIQIKRREKGEKRYELCKKKILMGDKCRPLHGSLRYDENGVLVPEDPFG